VTVTGRGTGGLGVSTGGFGVVGTVTVGVVTVGTGGGAGAGGKGAGGTVTVGRLTVGTGGTWPMLVPAQAPSPARMRNVGSRTGTDRFRIYACNGVEAGVVSVSRCDGTPRDVARDLYEVLGVPRDADDESIKQAYRALARELHPDLSSDDESGERFREVTEAYAVLSDERSKRLYDRLGWRGRGGGIAPRRGMAKVYASNPRAFVEDLESVIASAVGRTQAKEPTRVVGEIELDAYEAHLGATRSVRVEEARTCSVCEGAGRRKVVENRESGRFLSFDDCAECGGTGKVGQAVEITVPPRTRDLDRIPLGPEAVTIVRVVAPREKVAIRLAASIALLAAIGFLLFLLAL
jgi:hypothetical protein